MSTPARQTAFNVLTAFRKNGAWSDGELKQQLKKNKLDKREAALATRLCYGVLQNRMLLDFYISACCNTKLEKLEPAVLDILRLGAYQLLFTDRIPESAAVNESVNMAKEHGNASGLVNGVLRTLARNRDREIPQNDYIQYLSIKYSHPVWLVNALMDAVGENEIEALLRENNSQPETVIQVNILKTTAADLIDELIAAGVKVKSHSLLEDCLILSDTGNIENLDCYNEGRIIIQDAASKLAVMAAGLGRGSRVLDGCAAPGGKTMSSAVAMGNEGLIVSTDIHEHKIKLIERSADRLGINIVRAQTMDAKNPLPEFYGSFDIVLADAPCSGFGIIRKKPDIRYKSQQQLANLPGVQLQILQGLSKCVKPGGTLLYTTCTLLKRENEDVVKEFLKANPQFILEDFILPIGESERGMLTLYPHIHDTDGFFISKMRLTYD